MDLAVDERIILMNPVDCALQEIDILFNTVNTELIGDPQYGTNFEQFLWELAPSDEAVERYIRQKIDTQTYYMSKLNYDVHVSSEPGSVRDIFHVEISLDQDDAHRREFVIK